MSRYDFDAPRLFVDAPLAVGQEIALSKEQSNYLLNVLRLTAGDPILTFNGRDGEWLARIGGTRKSAVLAPEAQTRTLTAGPDLDYFFAPLKHARLDYMVQKAVEMGASRLCPMLTRRTQVSRVNLDRMRANAIEAAEQCGLLTLPSIDDVRTLEQVLTSWDKDRLLIFCDEDAEGMDPIARLQMERKDQPTKIAVFIGPEGGFDPREREMINACSNVVRLSLGPRILRADTAAVAALAVVQACLGDWRS